MSGPSGPKPWTRPPDYSNGRCSGPVVLGTTYLGTRLDGTALRPRPTTGLHGPDHSNAERSGEATAYREHRKTGREEEGGGGLRHVRADVVQANPMTKSAVRGAENFERCERQIRSDADEEQSI